MSMVVLAFNIYQKSVPFCLEIPMGILFDTSKGLFKSFLNNSSIQSSITKMTTLIQMHAWTRWIYLNGIRAQMITAFITREPSNQASKPGYHAKGNMIKLRIPAYDSFVWFQRLKTI